MSGREIEALVSASERVTSKSGKRFKEATNGYTPLKAGKAEANACMGTTGKGKMLVGPSVQDEPLSIGKHRLIAIGSTDAEMQIGACRDRHVVDGHRGRCQPVSELVGTFKPQELIHGGCDQRRIPQSAVFLAC